MNPSIPTLALLTFGLVAAACGASDIAVSNDFPPDPDDAGFSDDTADDDGALDGGAPGDGDLILGGGSYAVGTIKIVIEHPEADTVTYELACFGDTATLIPEPTAGVSADRACTALAQPDVEEFLADGAEPDRVCTEIYGGPDTARVTGMLNGRDIDTTVDRSNGCGISDWDILLADVLPAALGER